MAPAGMSGAQDNFCLYQEIAPSFQRLPCPRYLMSCPWQFSTPNNLVATFLRSHDMSLQLEAFQGWPRRPQGPGVACKGREQLFSRKDPKGSKAKGAICFPTDSEDKQEKCPVSPILLVLIFQ
ncbi:uncharacterized protein [Gorilla gorilla gorilla]|uniref:uncharacterized protein isoform X1 n=1 Tax=Gorilla gorilla gorilla TaxID=9595 RepID=UPI002445C49A|nr:uncharacterized protein LOC101149712 isoform X1 [Gorilla gorilla gorilla]